MAVRRHARRCAHILGGAWYVYRPCEHACVICMLTWAAVYIAFEHAWMIGRAYMDNMRAYMDSVHVVCGSTWTS